MMASRLDLQVEVFSYWQCGAGRGHGEDVDRVFRRDRYGLPYIPGKTFRGVLRDALCRYLHLGGHSRTVQDILGLSGQDGLYFVDSAHIAPNERRAILAGPDPLATLLGTHLQSTAINDETGAAKQHSLRMTEVAIPLVLHTFLEPLAGHTNSAQEDFELIKQALPFFYIGIGSGRRRGLGRIKVSVVGESDNA